MATVLFFFFFNTNSESVFIAISVRKNIDTVLVICRFLREIFKNTLLFSNWP
jgi:hypothetical protein